MSLQGIAHQADTLQLLVREVVTHSTEQLRRKIEQPKRRLIRRHDRECSQAEASGASRSAFGCRFGDEKCKKLQHKDLYAV